MLPKKGRPKSAYQTDDQLYEHYKIEREIADRLKNATPEERKGLYPVLYDELFRRIPHQPLLQRTKDKKRQSEKTEKQLKRLRGFLGKEKVYLEIGPGDCHLAYSVAEHVKKVYAVDVSSEQPRAEKAPSNFEHIISDGVGVNLPPGSVDIAYSNQLMEHLHPDDAFEQLKNIYRVLAPGGMYICVTPNRHMGPHDISRYYDDESKGLHLKEYTNGELYDILKKAGFSGVSALRHIGGFYFQVPAFLILALELPLGWLPYGIRRTVARGLLFKDLLSLCMIATK